MYVILQFSMQCKTFPFQQLKFPVFKYKPGFICYFIKNDAYTVKYAPSPPIDITSELANFEISDGWLALVIKL